MKTSSYDLNCLLRTYEHTTEYLHNSAFFKYFLTIAKVGLLNIEENCPIPPISANLACVGLERYSLFFVGSRLQLMYIAHENNTLIPDERPLLEMSNLFVSLR